MGAWQEIVDYTVPSNTTSVTLNNFGTITKDDFVKVVVSLLNSASGSDSSFSLFANSATTSSQYHSQQLVAYGTSIGAGRTNTNFIGESEKNGVESFYSVYLKLSENDRLNLFAQSNKRNTSGVNNEFDYVTSSGTTFSSGITSLTLSGSQSSSIGTGSRIQIYKLAAEKVADITVESNTTQVDISNLSIDKDSEYLLVSDIVPTSATNIVLGVNDVTATNQYYYQGLGAFGSSTYAVRENQGLMIYLPTGQKGLVHSHIKLSNIGAFTGQHYGFQDYGTAAPTILNRFQVSTTESITSITKLNILAQTTNAIQAGSRFILYKLYE